LTGVNPLKVPPFGGWVEQLPSARRLHQAFDATFGISPHRYLKLRRMSMVRAALLSGCGPWRSVKAEALSHGFWHLGQFAQDYRALYGEAPSNTLARAPGGAVGALRDQECPLPALRRHEPVRRRTLALAHEDAHPAGHGLQEEAAAVKLPLHPPAAGDRFPPLFRDPLLDLAMASKAARTARASASVSGRAKPL
jgi:AraC-like DNA-binding protein